MSEQPPVRRVMISSTALDLPDHRKQARDACERMSMFPLVMEQMPASPAEALAVSREFVDRADFYLGIFAFRYGFVPEGQDKSITELEGKRGGFAAVVAVKESAAKPLSGWLAAKPADAAEGAGLAEGWVAMRMEFEHQDQARFVVLGLGARARVLKPLELREAVAEEMKGVLAQMREEWPVSRP